MEHNDTAQGELTSTLKAHATKLVESLECGDFADAIRIIFELNQVRDRGLYQEVGKLTRELHDAIVNFRIDTPGKHAEEVSQINDATHRLNYVVEMTERAANRTMDLVELGGPLLEGLSAEARQLRHDWSRLRRREITVDGFRELAKNMDDFFDQVERDTAQLSAHLNDILLAQDFQDLTGQVIKRVTALVTDVESNLVKLVKMASHVDECAGIKHDGVAQAGSRRPASSTSQGEGPQMHADKRDDVVSGQDDVDGLLSSLGF